MAQNEATEPEIPNVFTEVRVGPAGVSATLYAEWSDGEVTVEDEVWYTMDEIQSGGARGVTSLTKSQETRETLAEARRLANVGAITRDGRSPSDDSDDPSNVDTPVIGYKVPSEGEIVVDKESEPKFGNGRVRVTNVTDKEARNYKIDDIRGSPSVADMNAEHPPDAPVVEGEYIDGGSKTYAFPVTRLDWDE